jgi:hypothetical protein
MEKSARVTSKGASSPLKVVRTPPSPGSLLASPFAALLELPFSRVVRALNAIDSLTRLGFPVTAPRRRRSQNRAGRQRNQIDALLVIARLIAGQLRTTNPTKVVRAMYARNKRNPLLRQIERATIHERLHNAARTQGFPSFEQFLRAMAVNQAANAVSIRRHRSVEFRPVIKPRRRGRRALAGVPSRDVSAADER